LRIRLDVATAGALAFHDPERAQRLITDALGRIDAMEEDSSFEYRTVMRAYVTRSSIAGNFEIDGKSLVQYAHSMVARAERWVQHDPSPEARYWVGISHEERGVAAEYVADPQGAVADTERAIAIFRELVAASPNVARYQRELALLHVRLAAYLRG